MNTLFEDDLEKLSRREFLRWSQRGLAGLFSAWVIERAWSTERLIPVNEARVSSEVVSPGMNEWQSQAPEKGRVLDNSLAVYRKPSFSSKLINMYWRDVVIPINAVTIGDKEPAHNRVWYKINDEGYAHSGKVQPVSLTYNTPVTTLPENGTLGEITVPFTDAVWSPKRPERIAYRLYYSTVYWLMAAVKDEHGKVWYRVPDDKLKFEYYVNAEHVRPIPAEALTKISPQVPARDKRLEIRLGEQVVVAYEGSKAVFMTRVASGGRFIDGDYTTPTGRYITNRKRPSRHMASEDLAAPSAYDLPGVPWVCYLTRSGISFHGTYWHNDFGKPRSHGCINLSPQAARWVYRWTNPSVPFAEHTWDQDDGTRVDVVA